MLMPVEHYAFSENDKGNLVQLADNSYAIVVSIIKECGQLYTMVGRNFETDIIWNHLGKCESNSEHDIKGILYNECQ